jgi:hypothetical protein
MTEGLEEQAKRSDRIEERLDATWRIMKRKLEQ